LNIAPYQMPQAASAAAVTSAARAPPIARAVAHAAAMAPTPITAVSRWRTA